MKLKTKDLALCALFAALIAVCAWISIPATVPFTLQTFAIFAALGLLGGKRGTVAVAVYLLLGAVGVPVFAGFQGGIGALLGTTGGYLLGFLLTALIVWGMEARFGSKTGVFLLSAVLGMLVCYAFGTAWYLVVYALTKGAISLATALGWCVVPFLIPDAVKIALAVLLRGRLKRHIPA
ncbi:MAG: biotin transporter BioY [Clostridiales bacterium]|nr:biotin transporter BioY [Clostridiales bacterium]MDD6936401.1 biotin transporter BioY [Clostridiales bacterium]MDY2961322.1 biotin transporter BioY [Oscillospiraceae bacterium]